MDTISEPENKLDVTQHNENEPLEKDANDDEKDANDENNASDDEKDTTNNASESTEKPEKDIDSDSQDGEQANTETELGMDANITYGAMNTQVPRTRKKIRGKRRARRTNKQNSSNPSETKVSSPLNPLKRKKTRAPRTRNKATKISSPQVPPIEVESDPTVDLSMDSKDDVDDVEYCLTVSNLPNSLSFMEIKNYFDTEVGPVDEIEMIKDDKTGFGAIRLSYQTEKECKMAKEKLQGKVVAGNKLTLEMAVVTTESDTETQPETQPETTEAVKKPWKPDLDSWEVDLQGMYGLKLQYLKSLGITPPLDKWVHVSNFRCDKSELRDIMEMAGNVQMCSVFTVNNKYANVMYSHPLEAVQAVAMLNNQMFYGQQLKVAMDRSPADTILLPKGLSAIGSGLGFNGKPLRNIVKHYERFLENKECLLNPIAFNVKDDHGVKNIEVKFEVKSVEDFKYTVNDVKVPAAPVKEKQTPSPKPIQTPSPKPKVQAPAYTRKAASPVVNSQAQTNRQYNAAYNTFVAQQPVNGGMGQGSTSPMGPPMQSTGPFSGPRSIGPGPMAHGPMGSGPMGPGPMGPGPMGPGPMAHGPMGSGPMGPGPMGPGPMGPGPMGPGPMGSGPMGPGPMGPGPMGPRPMGPGQMFNNEPVKMLLRNLPPSTTFALLCEKMSEWGHVVCLQLTTPGCAVVTFGNRMQADACFKHYNGRSIDNHIIQMQYG